MSPPKTLSALPPDNNLFRTGNTNFAAALIATNQLAYARAELSEHGTVFVFEDPMQLAAELERRYQAEVFPHVSPRAYSMARSFLIEEIDRLRGRRVGGHHASKA
jgi:hypothetical protein